MCLFRVPPGEILNEEFLKPLWPDGKRNRGCHRGATQPDHGDSEGYREASQRTAIRLGTFFKTSAEFWMNLQMIYDLRNAEKALPTRVSIEENRSTLA
jgi:plasmid maintenance system antidote protein VapI